MDEERYCVKSKLYSWFSDYFYIHIDLISLSVTNGPFSMETETNLTTHLLQTVMGLYLIDVRIFEIMFSENNALPTLNTYSAVHNMFEIYFKHVYDRYIGVYKHTGALLLCICSSVIRDLCKLD